MQHFYLKLSRREQYEIALAAISKYNRSDDEMQRQWEEDPKALRGVDGKPGRHHPFEGDYPEEIVTEVLNARYGHRKAFKEGWGVGKRTIKRIAATAMKIRADHVKLGTYRKYAHAPGYVEPAPPEHVNCRCNPV